MTRRADTVARLPLIETAVFVSAEEGARRCMVSEWKWREWVRTGKLMQPHVNDGQIQRWHWPSVEARLAAANVSVNDDPLMMGALNAKIETAGRRGRAAS